MKSIYIHIPYCIRKCRYCDFVSYPEGRRFLDVYTEALCCEIKLRTAEIGVEPADTVFFGGGTPSLLSPEQLERILTALPCGFAHGAEISLECNPGTVDAETLCGFRHAGINRLSIGLQTYDDRLLGTIGRIHTVSDFDRCLEAAFAAGFENISVDLMYGLPGQSTADWERTLAHVADCGIRHLSAYELIVEEHTPIARLLDEGTLSLPSEDEVLEMTELAHRYLPEHGFQRYEVSNYALHGYESRHNLNYWDYGCYVGLGAAAVTRRPNMRLTAEKDHCAYIEALRSGSLPHYETEFLDRDTELFEAFMLGLRKVSGIDLSSYRAMFGIELLSLLDGVKLEQYALAGLLAVQGGRLSLTEAGMNVMNTLISELFTGIQN